MRIVLPYGNTGIPYDFPDNAQLLRSRVDTLPSGTPGPELVEKAMQNAYGGKRLSELAAGRRTATVIVSDHTRPVPSKDILPPMLRELRLGSPGIEITLLVATGCHRPTTRAELADKLPEQILRDERIVVHDAFDAASNVEIGTLPSGAPLILDREAVDCDLLVAEGFIEPHFFAGFSGGRKSVLPGVCDLATVLGNHCSAFIDSPYARTGVLDNNPLHIDMLAAARMAKLAFIVNAVIDENKRTVQAFAGEFESAHKAGCEFLSAYCAVRADRADIVVTTNGGAPLDQNVYQCVKGLTAAEAAAKPGAVLILCAECADGVGGDTFFQTLCDCESPPALYESILRTPQSETVPDQWESQILARILREHTVILVTRPDMRHAVEDMKMEYAATLDDALTRAYAIRGQRAALAVIPDGVSVIVEANDERNW